MTERHHAVPRDCQGTKIEEAPLKVFTTADAEDLRHQMYLYLINYGFCKDKEQAKGLLKKHGFLTRPHNKTKKSELMKGETKKE